MQRAPEGEFYIAIALQAPWAIAPTICVILIELITNAQCPYLGCRVWR
ncbi:MAG: hypothetical protein F6J93_14630 [Oscillatoria sp. SIO1A7]|nr:hypothetical protein [Oscillatoria sp. SIO1A7]